MKIIQKRLNKIPTFSNLLFHDFYTTSPFRQPQDPDLNLKILGLGIRFSPRPPEPTSNIYKESFSRLFRDTIIATTPFLGVSRQEYNPKIKTKSHWMPDQVNPYTMDLNEHIANSKTQLLSSRSFPYQRSSVLFKKYLQFKNIAALKIVQSDKNSGLVAMHILHYHSMIQNHLSNTTIYKLIGNPDCPEWHCILEKLLCDHRDMMKDLKPFRDTLPKNSLKFLASSKTTLPVFHALPKLHKKNMPGRPIVGSPDWITTKWSILLDVLLQDINTHYSLKNSTELITSLENFKLQPNFILCSADVASLYTNMSLIRLFNCIEKRSPLPYASQILKFVCNSNFFLYGNSVYKQLDGIAMGTNCAVVCANIYMDDFDQQFAPFCIFYRRYIDDIFFILDTDAMTPLAIQQNMNSFIQNIKLDFDFNTNNVNFLDLTIFKSTLDTIHFKTYQKPHNIYQYLPASSCHNPATIKGYIKGELLRYCRSNTDVKDRHVMYNTFFSRLRDRSFSYHYLAPIFNSISTDERHFQSTTPPSNDSKKIPLIIPYYPNRLTMQLKQFIYNLNLHPYCSRLKIEFFIAFRKNRNVIQLCSSSNISDAQIAYLENSTSSVTQ